MFTRHRGSQLLQKQPNGFARLRVVAAVALATPAVVGVGQVARADDVSAPAILQDFENTYGTLENRTPDIFAAGYGGLYTPPPGRADSGNQSVGYDQYDRFDLGGPGNPTLYGTETGLKALVNQMHQMGGSAYIDLVWNHNGFRDQNTPGFAAQGGYPGFVLSAPGAPFGDFHDPNATSDQDMRLAGLIDIDQSSQNFYIRNPVVTGDSRNIPAGTVANIPSSANARFYPDQTQQPIIVFDPKTGEQNIKIYPFNPNNPAGGTPVAENAQGYLMRNAQWLVQTIGVDGFRVDAAKNMPPDVLNSLDRAVYRSSFRTFLNGQQENVFSFSEVFDTNTATLNQYVRKDINPSNPGQIGGNRDVLDFPLYFAMQNNLSGNGLQNDWNNVVNASFDTADDGLHNGSQGVTFVSSQDNGAPSLSNVAYAYTMMLPGNTLVYTNGHEFGTGRAFPQDGRGDALGGVFGNAITTLNDLRNRYGRGNYRQDWLEKENFAYERQGSSLVMLSNRSDAGFDSRTIPVTFAPGTHLVELTGNAGNSFADPHGDISQLLVVNADSNSPTGASVNARFLRNSTFNLSNQSVFTGDGYLIYGLPTPKGTMTLSNVAQVLQGNTPNPNDPNVVVEAGTQRISNIDVIKSNSFTVDLKTSKVVLSDGFHDQPADGDNALIKLDGGVDVNGNGAVDFTTPGSVTYGFEQFTGTHNPGFSANNGAGGDGEYAQTIDTSKLSEGMHYIEVIGFRQRSDGGPAVYTDWRQSIYVDLAPPVSALDSTHVIVDSNNVKHPDQRDFWVRSVDQTANNVHTFLDLPAATTDAQILAMVGSGSQTQQIDRDLFKHFYNNLSKGNHVLTSVTFKMDGTYSIQRFAGINTNDSPIGAPMGDAVGEFSQTPDGFIEGNDVDALYSAIKSGGTQFFAADDFNGNGLMDLTDWQLFGQQLQTLHDEGLTNPNGGPLVSQGTIDHYNFLSATVPEPASGALVLTAAGFVLSRRKRSPRQAA